MTILHYVVLGYAVCSLDVCFHYKWSPHRRFISFRKLTLNRITRSLDRLATFLSRIQELQERSPGLICTLLNFFFHSADFLLLLDIILDMDNFCDFCLIFKSFHSVFTMYVFPDF